MSSTYIDRDKNLSVNGGFNFEGKVSKLKKILEDVFNDDKKENIKKFIHEVKSIPKEEILANRSNAYQFIDFDKQELEILEVPMPIYKQETLKEAKERYLDSPLPHSYRLAVEFGAKWQQENSNINALEFEIAALKSLIQDMDATIKSKYSEEEVLELLQDFANDLSDNVINIKFWFNKFKKK
jgi:hypothetical protein